MIDGAFEDRALLHCLLETVWGEPRYEKAREEARTRIQQWQVDLLKSTVHGAYRQTGTPTLESVVLGL